MTKVKLEELTLHLTLAERRGGEIVLHQAAQIFSAEDLKDPTKLADALARAATNGLQIVLSRALRGE